LVGQTAKLMLLTFPTKESLLRKIQESPFGDSYLIIANFKALAGWNLIPLRPLTVLLGPNSAGKSSVYEAFSILSLLNTSLTEPGEFDTLLGLFDAKRDDSIKPVIGFSTPYEINHTKAAQWLKYVIQDKSNSTGQTFNKETGEWVTNGRVIDEKSFPALSKILFDDSYKRKLSNTNYAVFLEDLNIEEFSLSVYFDGTKAASWNGLYSMQRVQVDREIAQELMPNSTVLQSFESSSDFYGDFEFKGVTDICPWPKMQTHPIYIYSGKYYDPDSWELLEYEDELYGVLTTLFQLPISGFIKKMNGLKTSDVRELSSDWMFCKFRRNCLEIDKHKFAENSFSATNQKKFPLEIFRSEIDRKLTNEEYVGSDLYKLNVWLQEPAYMGTQYQLKIDLKACVPIDDVLSDYSLRKHIDLMSEKMKTDHKPYGDAVFEFLGRGYLVDSKGRELTFEKVGTGFSQIIPILAALSVDRTLMYKQPEVHLHPKLQSKVADCFVERVNRNRDPISSRKIRLIETHSEHFVLRILKRLRDSFADEIFHSSLTVYPEDLAILYFQPDVDKSNIHQIRVSESGGFIDKWPDGFFDDRDEDLW
jgi:AAA15 family ATPase/GTPase